MAYRGRAARLERRFCGCALCRRDPGARVVAGVLLPLADLQWLGARPVFYADPGRGHRAVCGVCGSALAAWAAHGERVELDACMLEDDRWTGCRSHVRALTRCAPPVRGGAVTAGIAAP
ncbi:MAG: GFA family protein [Pseudomonadota bacterium]